VDGANAFTAVSCPSVSLCVATDAVGNIVTSTRPAGGASAWTVAHADGTTNFSGGPLLTGVSCPSVSACVAVDGMGNTVTSQAPVLGPQTWHLTHVDNGITYECYHYGEAGPQSQPALEGVSCPSASLCVAVDFAGNVLTSTNPTAGSPAWSGADPYGGTVPGLWGVSCPSVSFCLAVDGYGGNVMSLDPAHAGSSQTSTSLQPLEAQFNVNCASGSLCFSGDLFESSNPTGGTSAWTHVRLAVRKSSSVVAGVSCTPALLCAAFDDSGNVIQGTTPTRLKAHLSPQLRPSGPAARIRRLLKSGGYVTTLSTPIKGSVAISWFMKSRGSAGTRNPVLIAKTKPMSVGPVPRRIRIALTPRGRTLLAGRSSIRLIVSAAFTPAEGGEVATRKPVTLEP
jgi:hypothetical protein